MLKVYLYKSCQSCVKAKRFLDSRQVDYEALAIRQTPPSIDELRHVLQHSEYQLKHLFNRSGRDYRELNLKDRLHLMSTDEALLLLSQTGNLVKRPFVVTQASGLVGFDELVWSDFLNSMSLR